MIENIEQEHHPIPKGTGRSIVQHLLDARDLDEADLVPIVGTPVAVTEILRGDRLIRQDEATRLADFFHVDASLFLEP